MRALPALALLVLAGCSGSSEGASPRSNGGAEEGVREHFVAAWTIASRRLG